MSLRAQKLDEEVARRIGERDGAREELETLKKEQEDLLVLLADQDTKIDKYKTKLKELGQEVSQHSLTWFCLTSGVTDSIMYRRNSMTESFDQETLLVN